MDIPTVNLIIGVAGALWLIQLLVSRWMRMEEKINILHTQINQLSEIQIDSARQISFIKSATHTILLHTSTCRPETNDEIKDLLSDSSYEYTNQEIELKHCREEYFKMKDY